MADFSNVIDQLNENKEANKTSLSNVNKNLAFRLGKINDSLRMMTLGNVAVSTISNNSNNDMPIPTDPPKPEKDSKPTGFGSTEIGKILKNDIGVGLKNLTGKITDPLTSLAKSIPGFSTLGKIGKSLGKSAIGASSATKKTEKDADAETRANKDTTFLEKIFKGIGRLILLGKDGLKKSAFALGAGLGALVGLLFSPLTILVAFFKSVGKELAYLKTVGKKIAGSKFFKVIGDFFGKIGKFVGKFTGLTKLKELGGGGIDKIIGSVKGFFGNIKNSLGNFAKAKGFVLGVDGKAVVQTNKFAKNVVNGITTVKNFFSGIGKTIGGFVTTAKGAITPVVNFFSGIGKTIGGFVTTAKGAITPVVNFFKSIITTVKAVLAPITSGFKAGFGFVTKFAAGFGSVLGKIFLPITILMGAFDFITGFIEGFKVDGILGGLEGGFSKLFGNLLGIPLDLLKQGIAWILGKFGFEDASAALKTFSFKDLIQKAIGGIFDMFKSVINGIIETAAKLVSVIPGVGNKAASALRDMKFEESYAGVSGNKNAGIMGGKNVRDQPKEEGGFFSKLFSGDKVDKMTEAKLDKESKTNSAPVVINNNTTMDNSSNNSSSSTNQTNISNSNPTVSQLAMSY